MNYYSLMIKRVFDYSGRSSRKEYWIPALISSIINIFLLITYAASANNKYAFTIIILIRLIFFLFLIITGIPLCVRRYHDSGYSGWFILVPIMNVVLLFFKSNPFENRYGPVPEGIQATTPPTQSQTSTTTSTSTSQSNDVYQQIDKLASLHKQGILSDDEFAAQKKKLLDKM